MARAATPAMAKFLMRTLLLRGFPEDERASARNQLTVWTDRLVYQDVILARFVVSKPNCRPPAKAASAFGRWPGPKLYQERSAAAGCSPPSEPAATKAATEPAAPEPTGAKLRPERRSLEPRRGKARPSEVGARQPLRPLIATNLRERFRGPTVEAAWPAIELRIRQRTRFIQIAGRQIGDLAGGNITGSPATRSDCRVTIRPPLPSLSEAGARICVGCESGMLRGCAASFRALWA